ncbi:MAG: SMP-30/gluconolactonase/LRE family protein [Cyclobacteriaceae bacterium]|nr:SMP-30/gluconolactonase/LRE family protein [Cyclobacteriaceae bacterium]
MTHRKFLILFLLGSVSCSPVKNENIKSAVSDTLALITEQDLIPEGTAYDPKSNRVFVGSMYKRKIISIDQHGRYCDFVEAGKDELWSVFGLHVDSLRNRLWAISTKGKPIPTYPPISDDSWQSRLYCYDLTNGDLKGVYRTSSNVIEDIGFNDLTVSKSGDIYITESINNRIYILKHGALEIVEYLSPIGFTFLNGITFSDDSKTLFVSSSEGLLRIDVATRTFKVLDGEFTITPQPIDGLSFHKNSLIAHQSSLVRRFHLSSTLDSIVSHEIIDNQNLDSSTTGEIGEDEWYYYIANSQIRSGVDYTNKRVKPLDSLEYVLIKRIKLNQIHPN